MAYLNDKGKQKHNVKMSCRLCDIQGLTLIELMVVLALSSVLLAAVYSIFTSQYRSWIAQEQLRNMQQSARTAMEFLARDIRMASFGVPETAVNGFSDAITPGNNATNGTDAITVITAYRQISALTADASRGDSNITVQSSGDAGKFNTGTKRYLYLDGISQEDNYEVTGISGSQLTLTPALTRDYLADSPVFLVKAVTYRIDFTDPRHPLLQRDENAGIGAQLIAPDIEDLQFVYQDLDGNWYDDPPVIEDVRAIRISLVARFSREDPEWERAGIGLRPAIEDRAAAATRDGYRRRRLTTVVEVRNMGL